MRGDRGSPKTRDEFLGVHGRGPPKSEEVQVFFRFLIISVDSARPSNGING